MIVHYPEIRIKDGWLIRENVSKYLHELWAKPGDKLADDKWMEQRVSEYQKAWAPYESKILKGMCEVLDLEFRHNIIDVYIAPWFHGFSDPLVIGVMNEPDEFIDVLTHELLHRLLTANTNIDIDKSKRRLKFKELFGDNHSFKTLVHIPVHAALKAIYLDVLNEPNRLSRDIEHCQNLPDYALAWEYVEKNDYKKIIQKLRKSYKEFSVK